MDFCKKQSTVHVRDLCSVVYTSSLASHAEYNNSTYRWYERTWFLLQFILSTLKRVLNMLGLRCAEKSGWCVTHKGNNSVTQNVLFIAASLFCLSWLCWAVTAAAPSVSCTSVCGAQCLVISPSGNVSVHLCCSSLLNFLFWILVQVGFY